MKICGLKWRNKTEQDRLGEIDHFNRSIDLNREAVTYPDHIDTNEDIDWIVMRNALEHAHVRIKSCLSCDLL